MSYRIGLGFDAHRFAPDCPLVLGGVTIPHPTGLEGHSDGDALLHALTDALLGAAGGPDIGSLFPSDDERWKGAPRASSAAGTSLRCPPGGRRRSLPTCSRPGYGSTWTWPTATAPSTTTTTTAS